MADLSDVEAALGAAIGAALYPGQASGASVAGVPVRVVAGWPGSQELDDAAKAGLCIVSIYAPPGTERNVTRYPDRWGELTIQPITRTLTRSGQTVTVGGPGTPYVQNLAVFVNGKSYIVSATSQPAATLAILLSTAISADMPGVSASGPVVTLPPTARIGAVRVGTVGTASREVRRVERQFQVIVWAPTPAARVAVVTAFDPVLADTPRLTLADGQLARLQYQHSADVDFDQKQGLFRRDLFFLVEFATTRTVTATQIVSAPVHVTDPLGATLADTNA